MRVVVAKICELVCMYIRRSGAIGKYLKYY